MSFERYNRFIKEMCFNKHWPMASVVNMYVKRAAAHYEKILKHSRLPTCTCTLFGKQTGWDQPPDTIVHSLFGTSQPHTHSYTHTIVTDGDGWRLMVMGGA